MSDSDDDDAATVRQGPLPSAGLDDEPELLRRVVAGDEHAFDLLFDRYFARISWYFTIFGRRDAKVAVEEVMAELFNSLGEPSELSLAVRAYRLACATELRHLAAAEKSGSTRAKTAKTGPAKVELPGSAKIARSRVQT